MSKENRSPTCARFPYSKDLSIPRLIIAILKEFYKTNWRRVRTQLHGSSFPQFLLNNVCISMSIAITRRLL